MLKGKIIFTMLTLAVIIITGCSNNGMFMGYNQTSVELSEANYDIVATNLMGASEAGYLIGLSGSWGATASTFALARVNGTGMLYKEALEDLWQKFEAEHGKIDGRQLALANVRYDSEALNLVVYTSIKVYIRADVIEFKK